jgi:hypothetical protein
VLWIWFPALAASHYISGQHVPTEALSSALDQLSTLTIFGGSQRLFEVERADDNLKCLVFA